MRQTERLKAPAALDTSFWNAACLAESAGYALAFFLLHAPQAVVDEIENERLPRLPPKAALFQELRQSAVIHVTNPVGRTVQVYGRGERAVLELAKERGWHALINEWRAHDYGRERLGLTTLSMPEMLTAVCYAGLLKKSEALHLLRKLATITSAQLMLDAARLINEAP